MDVDTTQYETGHIPGAVAFNWQTQLQNQTLRDIATKEEFEALLSDAGVTPETHVVLYGDNNNWFAAYAFWLFKYYGHENVSLLNGGRKKWLAEERETTTDVPSYPKHQLQGHARSTATCAPTAITSSRGWKTRASGWWTCARRTSTPARSSRRPT